MGTDKYTYRSYLLRLWRRNKQQQSSWYASLEDPETGTRVGFADLQALIAYLEAELNDLAEQDNPQPD